MEKLGVIIIAIRRSRQFFEMIIQGWEETISERRSFENKHGHFVGGQNLDPDRLQIFFVVLLADVDDFVEIGWKAQSQTLFEVIALEHFKEKVVDNFSSWFVEKVIYLEAQIKSSASTKFFFFFMIVVDFFEFLYLFGVRLQKLTNTTTFVIFIFAKNFFIQNYFV